MFSPQLSQRSSRHRFAEIYGMPGPEQIGQTGDNSYQVMFGREWFIVLTRGRRLQLYQVQPDGTHQRVTTELPPIFGQQLPPGTRRVSACFDQSARMVVAYES